VTTAPTPTRAAPTSGTPPPTASPSTGRTISAFAAVAIRRTLRDRGNLFFLLVFPLALIFLVGQQFGDEGAGPAIGVVTPGGASAEVAALADVLFASDELLASSVGEVDALESDVAAGRLAGGVVLPTALDDDVPASFVTGTSGDGTAVRQLVDSVLVGAASDARDAAALATATGADDDAVAAARATADRVVPDVTVVSSTLGEGLSTEFEGAGQFTVGASGQLLLFVFVTSLAASGALIQARRWGVTRRALAAPIRSREVLLGEAGGRLAVALLQATIIVVGTAVLYGVDWGDPLATGVVTVLFCLVGAACAMLLGAVASNDAQASGIGVVLGLGLAALGGCMLPIELFPDTLRQVAHITPHAWGLDALAEITRRDGGLGDVLVEVGVLTVYAASLLGLASWRLRAVIVATGR
jgi:ABC-2 type transport system permease protein